MSDNLEKAEKASRGPVFLSTQSSTDNSSNSSDLPREESPTQTEDHSRPATDHMETESTDQQRQNEGAPAAAGSGGDATASAAADSDSSATASADTTASQKPQSTEAASAAADAKPPQPSESKSDSSKTPETSTTAPTTSSQSPSPAQPAERPLCAKGCGFFGDPNKENMCSMCYRKTYPDRQPQAASTPSTTTTTSATTPASSSNSGMCQANCGFFANSEFEGYCSKCFRSLFPEKIAAKKASEEKKEQKEPDTSAAAAESAESDEPPLPEQTNKSRCWNCNKKIGLTAVQCKCGYFFCGKHRYPEEHACQYDFKKAGRAKLQKDNPTVRAKKLVRIDSDG